MKKHFILIMFLTLLNCVGIAQRRFTNQSINGSFIKSLTFRTSSSPFSSWSHSYVDIELSNGSIYNGIQLQSLNTPGIGTLFPPTCSCGTTDNFSNSSKLAFFYQHQMSGSTPNFSNYWDGILIREHEGGLCINRVRKYDFLPTTSVYPNSDCLTEALYTSLMRENDGKKFIDEFKESERARRLLEKIEGLKVKPPKPPCLVCLPYKGYLEDFPESNKFFEENFKKEIISIKQALNK
jgi:hypothetical protein